MTSTHEFEKIDATFALSAFKPGKPLIANMGAIAVFTIVPGAGFIDIDVVGNLKANG
jgi:hypothetical protein